MLINCFQNYNRQRPKQNQTSLSVTLSVSPESLNQKLNCSACEIHIFKLLKKTKKLINAVVENTRRILKCVCTSSARS